MPDCLFDAQPEERSEWTVWLDAQRRLRLLRGDDTTDAVEDAADLYGRVAG